MYKNVKCIQSRLCILFILAIVEPLVNTSSESKCFKSYKMGRKQLNHNININKIRFDVYSIPSKPTNKTVIIRLNF